MKTKQHTISESVEIAGVGIHTGQETHMVFQPAAIDHGIRFQRVDLEGQPTIPAEVGYVVDVSRGTTLEKDQARVMTIEHCLAALTGLQIDNVLIQIDGPELPILDGSSQPYILALKKAGSQEQNASRRFLEIKEPIVYRDEAKGIELMALPHNNYRVTAMVDYQSAVLGSQHAHLTSIEEFEKEIAPSRTFCFLHEVEYLHKQNLIQGGDMDNAIVIVDRELQESDLGYLREVFNQPSVEVVAEKGILNNVELHHDNEPARHKLLDVVGDLTLAGVPIKGQIFASRPGHAANVAFAKLLREEVEKRKNRQPIPEYDPNLPPVMDHNEIYKHLPHRHPFQLVDRVFYLDQKAIAGVKNVTMNEDFFQGHFPGDPVMPGVLMLEAMAQTGGILILNTLEKPDEHIPYFLGIEKCRFRKLVVPGDQLIFICELTAPIRMGVAKMQGKTYVAGEVVCEAQVSARIVKKQS